MLRQSLRQRRVGGESSTHAGVFLVGFEVETHEDVIVAFGLHVLDVIGEAQERLEAEQGEHLHGGLLFADELGFELLETDAVGDIDDLGDQGFGQAAAAVSGVNEDADAADMSFPAPELLMECGGGQHLSIRREAEEGEMPTQVDVGAPRGDDLGFGDTMFDEEALAFGDCEEEAVEGLFVGGLERADRAAEFLAEVQFLRIIFKHVVQHRISRSNQSILCGTEARGATVNFGSDAGRDPVEVAFGAAGDGQGDELRGIVGMHLQDELLEGGQVIVGGLEDQEDFAAGLEFFFPPIMGLDRGDEVDASGQARGECGAGQGAGDLEGGSGDEGDREFRFHGG
jgi:hypothetical protein